MEQRKLINSISIDTEEIISMTTISSGGGTIRHMYDFAPVGKSGATRMTRP